MLNALIVPSPKLPTSKTLDPNSPNPLGGTFARPQGELSEPFETKRLTKAPSVLNTLMNPLPGPLKSSASSRWFLLGVGDIDQAVDVGDAEWRKIIWYGGCAKGLETIG